MYQEAIPNDSILIPTCNAVIHKVDFFPTETFDIYEFVIENDRLIFTTPAPVWPRSANKDPDMF